MKTLKLIVLMLLTVNLLNAQSSYSAPGAVSGVNNTAVGVGSLANNSTGFSNVAIGKNAGKMLTTGYQNTFIGALAGLNATSSGINNTGIGYAALDSLSTGDNNLAIGSSAGSWTTTGDTNIFIGNSSGSGNTTGGSNTYIGELAGNGQNGSTNVAIGDRAGFSGTDGTSSVYSVFLGANAGKNRPTGGEYELHIQSQPSGSTNAIPLIYGNFAQKKVGIDTTYVPAGYTLAVNGKTITEEVQVMLSEQWPDYVFAEDYDLMPLTTLEAEIATLGHLPGVPSAEEVEENGHALGRMDAILLEKVEELTLHLIDMNKEMEKLRERNETLETRLSEVEDK